MARTTPHTALQVGGLGSFGHRSQPGIDPSAAIAVDAASV
jgi:hypothetical protein